MTTWLDGHRSFFLGAQAFLVDNDHETASSWASSHIVHNPAYKWTIGRFVEADRANNNRQLFSLDGLQMARPTIAHAPMNMNHSSRRVVGAYVATDLIYPTEGAASDEPSRPGTFDCPNCQEQIDATHLDEAPVKCPSCGVMVNHEEVTQTGEQAGASDIGLNPYIEALGVFWKHYFPEEYSLVEAAAAEGRLYYSMECIPEQIQCAGSDGCGETYEYAGRQSPGYCEHLNESTSDKYLINPHFTAGAILVPPVRPGWSNADVRTLVAQHAQLAEDIYLGLKSELSHLDPHDWELLMTELLVIATA